MFCGKRATTLSCQPYVFTDDIANPVFEISDREAALVMPRRQAHAPQPGHYRLDAVLYHPVLYANYPALAALPVILAAEAHAAVAAEFVAPWQEGLLSHSEHAVKAEPVDLPSLGHVCVYGAASPSDLKDKLLHEVQHAIQVYDMTSQDDYYWFLGEAEQGRAQYRRALIDPKETEENQQRQRMLALSRLEANLKTAKREIGLFYKNAPDKALVEVAFDDLNADEGSVFAQTHPNLPNRIVAVYHYADTLDLLLTVIREKQAHDPDPTLKNIEAHLVLAHRKVDFYMPREMQARETQARATLTLDERLAQRPYCAASWPPAPWCPDVAPLVGPVMAGSVTAAWAHTQQTPLPASDRVGQKLEQREMARGAPLGPLGPS